MSADLSLLNPSRPTSGPAMGLLLSDRLCAAWRQLVRFQRAIAGQPGRHHQDELDLYLEERFGGHKRWSA